MCGVCLHGVLRGWAAVGSTPSSTRCSLRGNRLTAASFKFDGKYMGLMALTNLQALDLSNNPLELAVPLTRTLVFTAIKGLPKLATLSLAGTWDDTSKPLTRDQRCACIRMLPTLRDPMSPLRCDRCRPPYSVSPRLSLVSPLCSCVWCGDACVLAVMRCSGLRLRCCSLSLSRQTH